MSIVVQQNLFLQDVQKLMAKALELGYTLTFGETFRTMEQQQIYIKSGRAKTLNSQHLKRMAIDFNIFKGGKLCNREEIKPLGDYWESLNTLNRWGGNWRGLVDAGKSNFVDAPHFERRSI